MNSEDVKYMDEVGSRGLCRFGDWEELNEFLKECEYDLNEEINESHPDWMEASYTVAVNKCGVIIGKGGRNIREISRQSGALVDLMGNYVPKSCHEKRLFRVRGLPDQVERAMQLIDDRIRNVPTVLQDSGMPTSGNRSDSLLGQPDNNILTSSDMQTDANSNLHSRPQEGATMSDFGQPENSGNDATSRDISSITRTSSEFSRSEISYDSETTSVDEPVEVYGEMISPKYDRSPESFPKLLKLAKTLVKDEVDDVGSHNRVDNKRGDKRRLDHKDIDLRTEYNFDVFEPMPIQQEQRHLPLRPTTPGPSGYERINCGRSLVKPFQSP